LKRTEEKITSLVTWACQNLPSLRHKPARFVADQFGDRVLSVNKHLGVEVANDCDATREVIITAFSEPSLFSLVHQITDLLQGIPGWRFTALKPPRGFEFALTVGPERISAKSLEFAPMPGVQAGIQLFTPLSTSGVSSVNQPSEEMAWLIVETGIGEELAGRLRHVEFSDRGATLDRRPIVDLETYVKTVCFGQGESERLS